MIYNANSIDLLAQRKDGGLDMFILSKGEIDASPRTQKLLLDKVEAYLGYIGSKEFQREFADVDKKKVRIVFESEGKLPGLLRALCEKIVPWAADEGVQFVVTEKSR